MGKKDIKAFLKIKRKNKGYRPVCERIRDYSEVNLIPEPAHSQEQAHRCMDCGTPFCHWACPIGNYIPEWNELVTIGNWEKAIELLSATNDFPEITGRLCPALCEYSCVLGINDDPVSIRENELAIIEYAFNNGLIKPVKNISRSGKKVAIIGSGPSGLSAAVRLNRFGHEVVVFEKDNKIGGILRYGIPDFKLDKKIIDRRLKILEEEGIKFITSTEIGKDYSPEKVVQEFDAVLIAIGSRTPRDLKIKGRDLKGIYFAMDYLTQSNRIIAGEKIPQEELIDARNKKVVIVGGGDTGADCVGVANRQNARCVVQIELMPKPPSCRSEEYPWPRYPLLLKTSSSHEEGGQRMWSILTKEFRGENGQVKKLSCVKVEFAWDNRNQCPIMKELKGTEFEIEADLVILAIGFLHPQHTGLVEQLKLKLDERGNIATDADFMTSRKGVFSAGDAHRGQSLIVWAIYEGYQAAMSIHRYLTQE